MAKSTFPNGTVTSATLVVARVTASGAPKGSTVRVTASKSSPVTLAQVNGVVKLSSSLKFAVTAPVPPMSQGISSSNATTRQPIETTESIQMSSTTNSADRNSAIIATLAPGMAPTTVTPLTPPHVAPEPGLDVSQAETNGPLRQASPTTGTTCVPTDWFCFLRQTQTVLKIYNFFR